MRYGTSPSLRFTAQKKCWGMLYELKPKFEALGKVPALTAMTMKVQHPDRGTQGAVTRLDVLVYQVSSHSVVSL